MSLTLTFLGASGSVTGSQYLLSDGQTNLLIECGMYQGLPDSERLNLAPFDFDIRSLDAVLITHAHIDHVGRLPQLIRRGYHGPVYMTAATQSLSDLTLNDSARIAMDDDPDMALYSLADVVATMQLVRTVAYHKPVMVGDFEIVYMDAGHILGSASILVRYVKDNQRKDILFSGDLGNSPQSLIRPTEHPARADVVVMETTYGDRLHEDGNPEDILAAEIQAVEAHGSTLLIPSFSLERAQELLHYIDHLKQEGRVEQQTKVFLDSPMAIRATEVFEQFGSLYNQELLEHRKRDNPFDFPGLAMTLRSSESRKIEKTPGTKVIIAGSGMMEGGRIVHHAARYLEDERNRLLFVGYQGEDTLGRKILEGAKQLEIGGHYITIHATVSSTGVFSAHADQRQLLNWLDDIDNVARVFLVHGDGGARESFAELLETHMPSVDIQSPAVGSSFSLDLS